jgi:hypothetical protein
MINLREDIYRRYIAHSINTIHKKYTTNGNRNKTLLGKPDLAAGHPAKSSRYRLARDSIDQ